MYPSRRGDDYFPESAPSPARTLGSVGLGGQVANRPTPITPGQALGTLLAAGCPQSALLMVAAQSAFETNTWGKGTGRGFNNFNFGNVTPSSSQLAAGADWMTQGVPNMKYLSFDDPVSGAKSMLGWLQSHGLLAYAAANDLAGYMAKLRAGCYLGCIGNVDPSNGRVISQSDYDTYASGIAGLMRQLSGVTPVAPPGVSLAPTSTWKNLAIIAGIIALAGAAAWALTPPQRAPVRVRRYAR